MLEFTFLSENRTEHIDCKGEFGLSIYIKKDQRELLFDLGYSDIYLENAKALGVEVSKVEAVVFSHGHNDHTEGIRSFVKENEKAPIYVHKNAFRHTFGMENDILDEETSGILWDKKDYESRLIYTEGVVKLFDDVYIVGDIPKVKEYAPAEFFYSIGENGELILDDMSHEQMLIIKEEEGIYIFSGCSHTGIISVIERAKELFPGEKVAGVIGGMHLYPASHSLRTKVCQRIALEEIPLVVPVHCTGLKAICMLKSLLGDKCHLMCAGDSWSNDHEL